jgi:transcriptional regulator with XRE-family HTH domain
MSNDPSTLVSEHLKALRNARGLTMRDLAQISGMSVNTISLIERGRSSPTISTLHRLATALGVKVTDLVQESTSTDVIFLKGKQRRPVRHKKMQLESLGSGLRNQTMEPLLVTLDPKASSGPTAVVHLGHELLFCMEGEIVVEVDSHVYLLMPGDSLLFEACLPHRWHNRELAPARALLVLQAPDSDRGVPHRHF